MKTIAINCELQIPAQPSLEAVGFGNEGVGTTRSVGLTLNLTGFEYTEVGACGAPGTHNNGKLSSTTTLKGYEKFGNIQGPQQGMWLE